MDVLYVATGERFVQEAIQSARSVRYFTDWSINIMTDLPDIACKDTVFDTVAMLETDARSSSHVIKIDGLLAMAAPDRRVLFLDTDTYVCGDIASLSAVLDRYDVAMVHAPRRQRLASAAGAPDWFPEPNSGVIALCYSNATISLLELWRTLFDEIARSTGSGSDQIPLRDALWSLPDVLWYVLPPEYNFRTTTPNFAGGAVKILHGRGHPAKTARTLNQVTGMRLWSPSRGVIRQRTHK